MSAALIALLAFHSKLTEGAAGCFSKVAETPTVEKPQVKSESAPEIEIRRVAPDAVR
jgi:hypothetical protein